MENPYQENDVNKDHTDNLDLDDVVKVQRSNRRKNRDYIPPSQTGRTHETQKELHNKLVERMDNWEKEKYNIYSIGNFLSDPLSQDLKKTYIPTHVEISKREFDW